MNLVKHMSPCLATQQIGRVLRFRQKAKFAQSVLDLNHEANKSWDSTICTYIERIQTVRKKSSVGNDRPLSLICLLRSSSLSKAGLQALPSVLTSVHGPACVLLVVVPGPPPLCSLRVTTTPSSFVMHSGSSLGFFLERKAQPDLPPVDNRFSILSPSPAYIPGALPRIGVHTSFRQQCHLPLAHTPNRRTCPRMEH